MVLAFAGDSTITSFFVVVAMSTFARHCQACAKSASGTKNRTGHAAGAAGPPFEYSTARPACLLLSPHQITAHASHFAWGAAGRVKGIRDKKSRSGEKNRASGARFGLHFPSKDETHSVRQRRVLRGERQALLHAKGIK